MRDQAEALFKEIEAQLKRVDDLNLYEEGLRYTDNNLRNRGKALDIREAELDRKRIELEGGKALVARGLKKLEEIEVKEARLEDKRQELVLEAIRLKDVQKDLDAKIKAAEVMLNKEQDLIKLEGKLKQAIEANKLVTEGLETREKAQKLQAQRLQSIAESFVK